MSTFLFLFFFFLFSSSPCSFDGCLLFHPCRLTSARVAQRLAPLLAGTRSVLIPLTSVDNETPHPHHFSSLIRAPGGDVNPAVTLGNNMCAGARARSTFPTKHPSRRVSTLIRHKEQTKRSALYSCVRKGQTESPAQQKMLHFLFVRAYCHGGGRTLRGRTVLQDKERKKEKERKRQKKVIINHIYDALREPAWERMNDR